MLMICFEMKEVGATLKILWSEDYSYHKSNMLKIFLKVEMFLHFFLHIFSFRPFPQMMEVKCV